MHTRLRLLVVEDSEDDARLLFSELSSSANVATYARVDTAEDMRRVLQEADWDIVISDHSLPCFNSLAALEVLKDCGKDIPFIIYSGEVSKHVAVAAMNSGAQDSIHKGDFSRLLPAMERELQGAAMRRAKAQADAEIHRLAFYDSLTGLPNRNLFCNHVSKKLTQRSGRGSVIYVLDVDRFLRINNCAGYKTGDALIRQVAQRLQECVPEDGMVARLGSDEFAVFLDAVPDDERARDAAVNIKTGFSRAFFEGAREYHITLSVGIATAVCDGADAQELLINAETAMFQAKRLGGNGCQFYVREMGAHAGAQLMLESALRGAVAREELVLEYQPSVDVGSGRLTGVEALIRWRHPELGMLQPDSFIPLANESGLITEVGKWALRTACRQAKEWHEAGHAGLAMAVNLSAVQFWQPGLVQIVADVLEETDMNPQCLELEITETVLMRDADATIATLNELKKMKIKISVDDFGTGYSSLSYLRRFPIDILKIDKSFSCDTIPGVVTSAIVQAVGALGRNLGLLTVAEGVETAEQLELFREEGYDRAQGFLFSKPRAAMEVTRMLCEDHCYLQLQRQESAGRYADRVEDTVGRVGKLPTQELSAGAV